MDDFDWALKARRSSTPSGEAKTAEYDKQNHDKDYPSGGAHFFLLDAYVRGEVYHSKVPGLPDHQTSFSG